MSPSAIAPTPSLEVAVQSANVWLLRNQAHVASLRAGTKQRALRSGQDLDRFRSAA